MEKNPRVIGKTPEGRDVIDGAFCFRLVDTHGIPLPYLVELLWERNAVPEWRGFVNTALNSGWNWKTVMARVSEKI